MINVDRIYQRVLTLANKEQRGYITPQEFNLFANQAQMDIFEQYFYDLNQFRRMPGNDTNYSDMVSYLEEKIQEHERVAGAAAIANVDGTTPWVLAGLGGNRIIPDFVYRITRVEVENFTCEKMNIEDMNRLTLSPLTAPTFERPVYMVMAANTNNAQIRKILRIFDGINPTGEIANNAGISGQTAGTVPRRVDPQVRNVGIFYIQRPRQVNWTYVVVSGKALYNANAGDAQDFDLHESEEQELVLKILTLAGFTLKDPNLLQLAAGEDTKNIQQEKQ